MASKSQEAALAQRNREGGLVAVNNVEAEQERDFEARFQGFGLDFAGILHALHVQHRAHLPGPDATEQRTLAVAGRPGYLTAGVLVKLTDLLVQRHLDQQCRDESLNVGRAGSSSSWGRLSLLGQSGRTG
jgi:hypothetical protein